jgi:tRNA A-37 threonylcarbamoyl transferase component Bud32
VSATPTVFPSHETHRAFFREALQSIRQIMAEKYGMTEVSVRPFDANAARLSIPIKITGLNKRGEKVRYFGKIIGSSDNLSVRSFQFFKNVYLQINAQDPIFETYETTEDMARDQFTMMKAIYDCGIPTPNPYGYRWINGNLWLIVMEFIDARPISAFKKLDPEQVDTVFQYLRKLHRMKIYHGDLKPDNIMIGKQIYILDVGYLRKSVSAAKKQAYDLACLVCSFLGYLPVKEIVRIARQHYSSETLRAATKYVELIQMRPDIHFDDETKKVLLIHLNA